MSELTLTTPIVRTARTLQVEGMFDLGERTASTVKVQTLDPSLLEGRDWNIGLIVGPSGAGKTTSARETFSQHWPEPFTWSGDKAVVDDFPAGVPMKTIVGLLNAVGFASPPAWLRPFHVLSGGEKFRVEVARALAEERDITVIDEFTSVVDRQVAQVGSHAVAKTVRRTGQKLVAVSCHYDIEDWLQPDWVFQPHLGKLTWRTVQPRPRVEVELYRGDHTDWAAFRPHHYLSESYQKGAKCLVATVGGQPAAFYAVIPLPSGTVQNAWRGHRLVVAPDYQGLGLGIRLSSLVGGGMRALGKSLYSTSAHPARIAGLNSSPDWVLTRKPSRNPQNKNKGNGTASTGRLTAGFRYAGPALPEIGELLS